MSGAELVKINPLLVAAGLEWDAMQTEIESLKGSAGALSGEFLEALEEAELCGSAFKAMAMREVAGLVTEFDREIVAYLRTHARLGERMLSFAPLTQAHYDCGWREKALYAKSAGAGFSIT